MKLISKIYLCKAEIKNKKFLKKFEFVRKTEENGENGRLYRVNCLYLSFIDFDFL